MSILIKDMKMPPCCDECWAMDYYGDYPRCLITGEQHGYRFDHGEYRMPDCPLIPIPPHGRLIDADALMKHKGDCYDADGHLLYAVGTGNILCAQTIIEAEENK